MNPFPSIIAFRFIPAGSYKMLRAIRGRYFPQYDPPFRYSGFALKFVKTL